MAAQLSKDTRAESKMAKCAISFVRVLFSVLSPEEAKLDDGFRLGVWIGMTSRSGDHLIFDGDEVRIEGVSRAF